MWKHDQTDEFNERFKKFEKKNRDSLSYVLNKLSVVAQALANDGKIETLKYNFLRHEREGVYAVRCSSKGKRPLRLYFFAHLSSETLHLLTIGDKNTQTDDIKWCANTAKNLKAGNYGKQSGDVH